MSFCCLSSLCLSFLSHHHPYSPFPLTHTEAWFVSLSLTKLHFLWLQMMNETGTVPELLLICSVLDKQLSITYELRHHLHIGICGHTYRLVHHIITHLPSILTHTVNLQQSVFMRDSVLVAELYPFANSPPPPPNPTTPTLTLFYLFLLLNSAT